LVNISSMRLFSPSVRYTPLMRSAWARHVPPPAARVIVQFLPDLCGQTHDVRHADLEFGQLLQHLLRFARRLVFRVGRYDLVDDGRTTVPLVATQLRTLREQNLGDKPSNDTPNGSETSMPSQIPCRTVLDLSRFPVPTLDAGDQEARPEYEDEERANNRRALVIKIQKL